MADQNTGPRDAKRGQSVYVLPALGVVYLGFGAGVVTGKVAIETIPPLLVGARFAFAGALILAWLWWRGDLKRAQIVRAQWMAAFFLGAGFLLGGQGGMSTALQSLSSSTVALVQASIPLFVAVIGWAALGRQLGKFEWLGTFACLAGLIMLFGPEAIMGRIDARGLLFALGGAISWAVATLYEERANMPRNSLLAAAMWMLCGGALLGAASVATGEWGRFDAGAVTNRSLIAIAFMFVVVSLVAFPAFTWLLGTVSATLASSFLYVAPVVAIFFGWLLLGERVRWRTLAASAVIVGGVALMVTGKDRSKKKAGSG